MDSEIQYLYAIKVSLLVTTEIAFVVGLMTHMFILAITVHDWRKGRTLSTSDQVIISIMISRMFLQTIIQLNLFGTLFCEMCTSIYYLVTRIIYFSTMFSSLWLSTLLCVVFFFKIYSFRSEFFLWLRTFFSKKILYFIIVSLLLSIGQTSVIYLVPTATYIHFDFLNSTETTESLSIIYTVLFPNIFCPLCIFLVSSLLLTISISLHIQKMKCNRGGTSSVGVYYRIIRYTTGSIFTSLSSAILSMLAVQYNEILGFVLLAFPWTMFGTLHSILLIYATPKLKNPVCRILKHLGSKCMIKREEPRELVTVTK